MESIKTVVEELRKRGLSNGTSLGYHSGLMDEAADTIERLQAEIERLNAEAQMADGYADALEQQAKAEAIKEFAERLKKELKAFVVNTQEMREVVDNTVEEMVGEE